MGSDSLKGRESNGGAGTWSVAVVGATGLVGRTILRVLEERHFPISDLLPLASERSAGSRVSFAGREIEVHHLDRANFDGFDFVFFSAGASVSREHAPRAATQGALVIDNSSAFRLDAGIDLVVPEVNGHVLPSAPEGRIIANPNCSTIQMVVALQPLHQVFGLESVVVSTYQSVSGSGAKGLRALDDELPGNGRYSLSPYPHPIAHNVVPHIDTLGPDGWSGEELKMIRETRKIMDLPDLHVVPTTVRVPVRVGHSESVYARFAQPISPHRAREVLRSAPGVIVQDDPEHSVYPLAIEAEGRDEVFVGRIRQDPEDARALALWVVADNLRKGAATNAVQIAETVITRSKSRLGRSDSVQVSHV